MDNDEGSISEASEMLATAAALGMHVPAPLMTSAWVVVVADEMRNPETFYLAPTKEDAIAYVGDWLYSTAQEIKAGMKGAVNLPAEWESQWNAAAALTRAGWIEHLDWLGADAFDVNLGDQTPYSGWVVERRIGER